MSYITAYHEPVEEAVELGLVDVVSFAWFIVLVVLFVYAVVLSLRK